MLMLLAVGLIAISKLFWATVLHDKPIVAAQLRKVSTNGKLLSHLVTELKLLQQAKRVSASNGNR